MAGSPSSTTATKSSIYATFPVDSSRRQIRLLVLRPGAWDTPIHCSLMVESLNKCPDYSALSYCWGKDTATATILVENRPFHVRKNLYSILQRLRRGVGGKDMVLWIDAICINQIQDALGKEEKSDQIAMMVWVYWHSRQVLVWLGNCYTNRREPIRFLSRDNMKQIIHEYREDFNKDPVELDYCFHLGCFFLLLHEAGRITDFARYDLPPFWNQFKSRRLRRYKIPITSEEFKTQYATRLYYVMRFFSETQWPTRMWTLQEFAVGPRVSFCFGTAAIPQELFSKFNLAATVVSDGKDGHEFWSAKFAFRLQWVGFRFHTHGLVRNISRTLRPLDKSPLRSMARLSRITPYIIRAMYVLNNAPPSSLFEFCAVFGTLEATCPIDKVLAITGFMEFMHMGPSKYKHTDQVAEVYVDISASHINICNDHPDLFEPLAPLRFCRGKNKFKDWHLPSWVVDWTSFGDHTRTGSSARLQDSPPSEISWLSIETSEGDNGEKNEEFPFRFNGATRYSAANGLAGEKPSVLYGYILAVSGQRVGTVIEAVPFRNAVAAWQLFNAWPARSLNGNQPDHATVLSRRTKMLRTLCAGHIEGSADVDWPRLVELWAQLAIAFSIAWRYLVEHGNGDPITFGAVAGQAADVLVSKIELTGVDADDRKYASKLLISICATCSGNSLFVIDSDNLGVGGSETCVEDEIYVLHQGRTPFALRRSSPYSSQFVVVSECYVDELMNGEAAKMGGEIRRIEIR